MTICVWEAKVAGSGQEEHSAMTDKADLGILCLWDLRSMSYPFGKRSIMDPSIPFFLVLCFYFVGNHSIFK